MKSFKQKVAVITGAGSGMGRYLAVLLAKDGADVCVCDVNEETLNETVAMLRKYNVSVSSHLLDVSDKELIEALPQKVIDQHGKVDLVFNNAGVGSGSYFKDMHKDNWDWVMGINFEGVINSTRAFIPHMINNSEAAIVNTSSIFGMVAIPGQSVYHATKFAIRGFTESLALEMKQTNPNLQIHCVHPGHIGTNIASSARMSEEGFGGLFQARQKGGRTTAKQVPMGLNSMPADFVNAYVLGSVGHTEAITGACATFLYCLQAAVRDIRSGVRRVAVVGNAESVIMPEVSEGFSNMSALGSDENLAKLDGADRPDWRRASRPFGENCGFTLAEGTQYVVLMDDALTVELGADVHGAIPEIFINADGVKKSISAPGVGNTISFAKAVASAASIVGKETVQKHSFVHAHGSSTPANRTTESNLINRVAEAFDINDWPVTAVKSYVGHTISTASGDQLMSALGTFKYQIIPGIKTITKVADDVNQKHTVFPLQDMNTSEKNMHVAFINSKGFGGNNATAVVLSPQQAEKIMAARYGDQLEAYFAKRETTRNNAEAYANRADAAELDVVYRFGEALVDEDKVEITKEGISIPGYAQEVAFDLENPFSDM